MPLNLVPQTGIISLLSSGLYIIKKLLDFYKEYKEAKAYVEAYKVLKSQHEEQKNWVKKTCEDLSKTFINQQLKQRYWVKRICMITVLISLVMSVLVSFLFPWKKTQRNPAASKCPSHEESNVSEVKLYLKNN